MRPLVLSIVETQIVDFLKGAAATTVTLLVILAALKFGADNLDAVKKVRNYVLG